VSVDDDAAGGDEFVVGLFQRGAQRLAVDVSHLERIDDERTAWFHIDGEDLALKGVGKLELANVASAQLFAVPLALAGLEPAVVGLVLCQSHLWSLIDPRYFEREGERDDS
jgi:hypothetical protein